MTFDLIIQNRSLFWGVFYVVSRFIPFGVVLVSLNLQPAWAAWSSPDTSGGASSEMPAELKGVGITEHLGDPVSIGNLKFRDEAGQTVVLSDYFRSGRPVLLTLIYYECPNLCNFVLNGLVSSLREMPWKPGTQFDVIAISMDPREEPDLAARKKAAYLASYRKPETAPGWHFLTALPALNASSAKRSEPPTNSAISQLAREVGFGYKWIGDQYAHGAAIYVLTPEGRISHYLYGIDFPESSLRLSLVEASHGKIGSIVDRALLFCYHYDPQTRKYSLYVMRLMQLGGGGTAFFLALYLLIFWVRERRLTAFDGASETGSGPSHSVAELRSASPSAPLKKGV